MSSLRLSITAAVVVAVGAGLAWGRWSYGLMRQAALEASFLPHYRDPPPGKRAPSALAFGNEVGKSSLDEVRTWARRLGLDCPDTSVRAMLRRARAERRLAQESAHAGPSTDAVSGASGSSDRRSPREYNPQVRLSCSRASAATFSGERRPPQLGRLLFVFDSAAHPLRHASFQRIVVDPRLALREFEAAARSFERTYGRPSVRPQVAGLPRLTPVAYQWTFSDLVVRVTALNFGAKGTSLSEIVEVPLPLRPDAPALAHGWDRQFRPIF